MLRPFFITITLLISACSSDGSKAQDSNDRVPNTDLLKLSQDLLYSVRTGTSTTKLENSLSQWTSEALADALPNDRSRNLFWINMYNAWYQLFAIRDNLEPPRIFTHRGIVFKGFSLTLDDIEHGILRRYRSKYSLGYLPQLLPSEVIRTLAIEKPDFRIHFALNCGARSCPPIAFYEYDRLDQQLDLATRTFLVNETIIDEGKKRIEATRIMEWFSGDFGGKKGQLEIIGKYLDKDLSGYEIRYRDYDWTKSLMNFSDLPR